MLTAPASAAVFDQAIHDATDGGRLDDLAASPGRRRRLRRLIEGWTIAERHRERNVDDDSPAWTVFLHYRRLLAKLNAEDDAGLAVWASIELRDRSARTTADGDHLVFLDFDGRAPARWRVLKDALSRPRVIDATLAFSGDPALAELDLATAWTRDKLLELGLVEAPLPLPPDRPAGLRAVEERLFREETTPIRIESGEGLSILGGPEGENLGRLVAREVRALLDQGADPGEILIVVPHWDDQADSVCEALRRAGLPVHDASPRPLDLDPAIAALLQAARLPVEDWETDPVVRLLRNGQLQPQWRDAEGLGLAEAAAAVRDSSAFRGSQQILNALRKAAERIGKKDATPFEQERRNRALRIVEQLVETLDALNQPRPWFQHVAALKAAAAELGIGHRDGRALEALWDALDDRADALKRLKRDDETADWENFVATLGAVAAETPQPRPSPSPKAIRAASIDEVEGCRASFVFLVGLAEGSLPRRSTAELFLDAKPGGKPSESARRAHAVEMLRFLRVLGAADRRALLAYPTTDAKGQPLLRAGFLDELLGALSPAVETKIHRSYSRFHPALLDGEDLAVSAVDRLILAAALAGEKNQLAKLRALAADPSLAEPLAGAAAALRALDARRRGTPLGEYEGRIHGAAAIAEIARSFGADYPFSPSQLETYLNCPYQFFARHVLHLKPTEERDELDEDFTERGSKLHDILEEFEQRALNADDRLDARALLAAAIESALARNLDEMSDLERGLHEIELRQIERMMDLYIDQREQYAGKSPSIPKHLEYGFGDETPFAVEIDGETVRIQGWVDRVDLVAIGQEQTFRVIDYKSGNPPSGKEVTDGWMVQLPLYAMAVEQLLFGGGDGFAPPEMGYWGLKEAGYKTIEFKNTTWEEVKEATLKRVFETLQRLRSGEFVIAPRKDHCEKYCEYRNVCRIRQVRAAGKARGDDEE